MGVGEVTWPPRPCQVCGKDIPFYDGTGRIISKWKYIERKTCSKDCYGKMHAMHRRAKEPLPEPTMMDRFILGEFRTND